MLNWLNDKRDTIIATILIALLVFVFYMGDRQQRSAYWEGEGTVNMFPVDSKAKNYRVQAYIGIDMKPRGVFGSIKRYDINYVLWPNGGKTNFEDCLVSPLEQKNNCIDNDLKEWRLEIVSEPKSPDDGIDWNERLR